MRRLIDLMARLRDPERGCPWDRAQTFATIAPYTIEEAYEVADAIARGDLGALREELGDLLFQVVFHARMAEEQGAFDLRAVIDGLVAKMRRRHPHVFGDASVDDAAAQSRHWEAIKAAERGAADSALDGIALALPALVRAAKVQRRAARVGFDWDAPEAVLEKVREETAELAAELAARDRARLADELGDLLFAAVNLARHLGVDAEDALRRATARFEARFRTMERLAAARGTALAALDAEALEALWAEAKAAEAARS
ncbi:nucleoside triphosphate pyrophosphohydrolase [Inmirania thermothiophila]|uniref:nucleoside triphosphate pyrophosphohydrolase n=1 Tax=Inmirania thermothiophila TaxID=1750597 RepID=UPI001B8724F5|nr:nucleoside triphosphate pyrophosphohydrolase [Inmirania thermothiophila]